MIRRALAAAVLALAAAAGQAQAATPIEIHAHRGGPYADGRPMFGENTMPAFRHAASEGYVLELDVKLTKDGVPVVIHDATLDRTTNCGGRVDALTLAQLAGCRVDVLGVPGSGLPTAPAGAAAAPVPTLAEVLRFARDADARVNMEIKNIPTDPDFDPGSGYADRVIDAVAASAIPLSQLMVQSFWAANLDRVRERLPDAQTSYLTLAQTNDGGPAFADSRSYDWVSPGWPVSAAYVSEAHGLGLRVVPYTLDSEADLRAAAAAHVDEVISNDPTLARRVLASTGPPSPAIPPPPSAAACSAARATRTLPPVESYDAKRGAPRVFAMQFEQDARHVISYRTFRTKIECMIRDYVLPRRSRTRPNVVAFNEDVGLATIATGSRGATARDVYTGKQAPTCTAAGAPCGAFGALSVVGAEYGKPLAAYHARFAGLNPVSGVFVATTDTFVRGWMQTFSDMARRYGVYILGSNDQAPFRESTDPADIAAFADPDLPAPSSVFVATGPRVYNEVFMWGPHDVRREGAAPLRNVVAANKKVPLTDIENLIQLTPGPSTGPDAAENLEPYALPGTRARIGFATSLPAFVFGRPGGDPCADVSKSYMRCLHKLGANLVIQDEANPGKWGTYTAKDSGDNGAWQPMSWMTSTWRQVADRSVGFAYNVTAHMVGNLADLPFDGQTAITQRGLGAKPVTLSKKTRKRRKKKRRAAARRSCNYVGNSRFLPGTDPDRFTLGGESFGVRQFAGAKTEFLGIAPWVVSDRPRAELQKAADELGPDGNGARENDYVETAVIADLPFPADPKRPSCAGGPAGPSKIRLVVRPRRVRAGRRSRLRFYASALVYGERRALRGATIRVGRKRVRTNRRGRASMRVRFRKRGRVRVRVRKQGFRSTVVRIRVLRPKRVRASLAG